MMMQCQHRAGAPVPSSAAGNESVIFLLRAVFLHAFWTALSVLMHCTAKFTDTVVAQMTVAKNLLELYPNKTGFLTDDEGAPILKYLAVSRVGRPTLARYEKTQVEGTTAIISIVLPTDIPMLTAETCTVSAVADLFRTANERCEEGAPLILHCVSAIAKLHPALSCCYLCMLCFWECCKIHCVSA